MPWFIKDYHDKTAHLSLTEDAVYRRTLDYLWTHPEGLTAETERRRRCLRITEAEDVETWPEVSKFLTPAASGFYRSPQLDEHYADARHRSEAATENGRLGGRPTHRKDNEQKPTGLPDGLPEQKQNDNSTPSPSPSPSTSATTSTSTSENARAHVGGLNGHEVNDRATAVVAAYPEISGLDKRPTKKGGIHALAACAAKVKAHPDYPWEEHAMLERELNPTPQNFLNWLHPLPDPGALQHLRTVKAMRGVMFDPTSEPYRAAEAFLRLRQRWQPESKFMEADVQRESISAVRINDIDGRPWDHLRQLFAWLERQPPSRDGFTWRTKLHSLERVRENWNHGKFEGFAPKEAP